MAQEQDENVEIFVIRATDRIGEKNCSIFMKQIVIKCSRITQILIISIQEVQFVLLQLYISVALRIFVS